MSNEEFLRSISKDYYEFIRIGTQHIKTYVFDKDVSESRKREYIYWHFLNALYLHKAKGYTVIQNHGFKLEVYSRLSNSFSSLNSDCSYINIFKYPGINKLNAKYITPTMVLYDFYMKDKGFIHWLEQYEFTNVESAMKELEEIIEQEKKDIDKIIEIEEKEFYEKNYIEYKKNKSPEVISYLDYVGKIYTYLNSYNKMEVVRNTEDGKKIVAYFLALFYFVDGNVKTQFSGKIRELLNKKGLKLENVTKILNIDLSGIEEINPSKVLVDKFPGYSGKNTIFYNLIKEHFHDLGERKAILLELLEKLDIDSSLIDGIYDLVYDIESNKDKLSIDEYRSKLNAEMIKFIEDSYKIYKKISQEKVEMLNKDSDYISLAILINLYFNNYKRLVYFKDKNINLDTIYTLTGIKPVNIEELKSIKINNNEIVSKFYSLLGEEPKNDLKIFENYTFSSEIMKTIYYSIAGDNIPAKLIDVMNKYLEKKEEEETKKEIDELFKDMDVSIFKYLSCVMVYYDSFKKQNLQGKNAEALSLLLGTYNLNDELGNYCKTKIGISHDDIFKHFGVEHGNKYINPRIMKDKFSDFIFGGVNEGRERKDITVASILSNISNKKINDSFQLREILKKFNIELESFEELETKLNSFIEQKKQQEKEKAEEKRLKAEAKEKNAIDNGIKKIKEHSRDIFECLTIACKIQKDLMDKKDKLYFIKTNSEAYSISIIIASLLMDTKFKSYFDNEGITLRYILSKIGYSLEDLKSIDFKDVTDRDIYYANKSYIENSFDNYRVYTIEEDRYEKNEYYMQDLGYLLRRVLGSVIGDNEALRTIVGDKEKYDRLRKNLIEEPDIKVILPVEELLEGLEEEVKNIPSIDISNHDALLEFMLEGDKGLSKYSDYIISLITEIGKYLNLDDSIESLDTLAEQVYVDTPIKTGLITKIFRSSKNMQRTVNSDVLKELSKSLDDNITNLDIQIIKYREIFKAVGLYLSAIKNYYKVTESIIEKIDKELENISDETSYEYLDCIQIKQGLITKLNAYNNTTLMMRQQEVQLFQTIQNHITTKTALQTSKNDVIPVIGSEILFRIGTMSQKEALELSNNLVILFKGIIGNNTEATKQSLEALKITEVPQELLDNITLYIKQLDEKDNSDAPKVRQLKN